MGARERKAPGQRVVGVRGKGVVLKRALEKYASKKQTATGWAPVRPGRGKGLGPRKEGKKVEPVWVQGGEHTVPRGKRVGI